MPFATFARIRNSSIYANGSVVILYSILPSSHSFPFELMRANWQEARTFSANREQSSELWNQRLSQQAQRKDVPIMTFWIIR